MRLMLTYFDDLLLGLVFSTQLYFKQTMKNSKRAKISDICVTGRQGRDSALTDAQNIV